MLKRRLMVGASLLALLSAPARAVDGAAGASFQSSRACATPEILAGHDQRAIPRPQEDQIHVSPDGRFAIHFPSRLHSEGGRRGRTRPAPVPAVVEQVVQTLTAVHQLLVEQEGWLDPAPQGTFDIYLIIGRGGARGSRAMPVESTAPFRGEGASSYVVLDGPSNTWPLQALHQYVHAVQMAYSVDEAPWFHEASALLTEHRLAGGLALSAGLLERRMRQPERSLTAHEPGLRGSGALYLGFLTETYGERVLRTAWEMAARRPGGGSLAALDASLRLSGQTSLLESFRGFTILNGFPDPADRPEGLYGSLGSRVPTARPAHEVSGSLATLERDPLLIEPLGASYVRLTDLHDAGALRVFIESEDDTPVSADALVSWRHALGGWLAVPFRFEGGGARLGIPLEPGAEVVLVIRNESFGRGAGPAEVRFDVDVDPGFPYDLSYLSADSSPGQIDVSWGSETETQMYGWVVYRSMDPQGPFEPLTAIPLPSLGESETPLAYHYADTDVQPGELYYYQVEGVTLDGLARRTPVIVRRAAPAGS